MKARKATAPQSPSSRLSRSLLSLAGAALSKPHKAIGSVGRAAGELVKVARGTSAVEPAAGDRRFDDPTWCDSAVYRRLMQGHLALARETQRLAGELGLSPRDEARARLLLGNAADTLAPTNTLLGNPAAMKRTLETGGRNLMTGVAQLVSDWRRNGGLPASVDVSKFKVGGNLAATPGDVVHRSERTAGGRTQVGGRRGHRVHAAQDRHRALLRRASADARARPARQRG